MSDIIEYIKTNEGFRSKPYRCTVGKLTIGYGRNLEANGISEREAFLLLYHDVHECKGDLQEIFGAFNYFHLAHKTALIDMRFNLGSKGFRKFKKMISAVRAGDWDAVIKEIKNSLYYKQVTGRANRNIALILLGGG